MTNPSGWVILSLMAKKKFWSYRREPGEFGLVIVNADDWALAWVNFDDCMGKAFAVSLAKRICAGLNATEDGDSVLDAKAAMAHGAREIAKLGGQAKSKAKAEAARANGKLGGRPKKRA